MSCMLYVMETSFAEREMIKFHTKRTYELEVLDIRIILKRKESEHEFGSV